MRLNARGLLIVSELAQVYMLQIFPAAVAFLDRFRPGYLSIPSVWEAVLALGDYFEVMLLYRYRRLWNALGSLETLRCCHNCGLWQLKLMLD